MLMHVLVWVGSVVCSTSSNKEFSVLDQRIWSVCSKNGSCSCGPDIFDAIVCTEDQAVINIQDCYCMFYDKENRVPYIGTCFFSCFNRLPLSNPHQKPFYSVEHYSVENASLFNEAICSNVTTLINTNREGRFCGRCKSEFGLAVYSYHYTACIKCTDYSYKNWIKYFAVALLPLTLFIFLVIILKINVPSSHLNGTIFMMQCLTSPVAFTFVWWYCEFLW